MNYKNFKDYQVTLHNAYKQSKIKIVKKCASKQAAVRYADAREKIENPSQSFRATACYELDEKGKPMFG